MSSARRPKRRPPCGAARFELVEGYSRDGVLIGLGVGARESVGKSEDNCASSMARLNMDEMEWLFEKDKTQKLTLA